jgi:hypothetical protein
MAQETSLRPHMKHALINRGLLVCLCLLAVPLLTAHAQDAPPWKVDGKLLGEAEGASDFEKSKDVSGIACDRSSGFPRLCLVADDETQGAQIVILKDGELVAGDFIKLTDAQHAAKPLELDAEGVAFENGSFYIVGSHGRPRHRDDPKKEAESNAKAQATRQIFRVTLDASSVDMKSGKLISQPAIKPSTDLAGILQRQPDLSSSYDRALEDNGLTIEGIAVRDGRLYAGMRGPVLGTDAAVLSVPLSAVFDGQQAPSKLHKVQLEKDTLGKPRGVRDMTRHADGFLVLAGPVNDPPEDREIQQSDYSIYVWDGESKPKRVMDVPAYGKKVKPEALLPLDGDAERVRVLLLFDGPKEGAPRSLEVKLK